jgi:hypothetical protein
MPGIMPFSEDTVPEKAFTLASLHESSSHTATTTPATITAAGAITCLAPEEYLVC